MNPIDELSNSEASETLMPTTTQTPAVRPGSPELEELLARIAAGAEQP